jgi:hypothetical protein
MVNSNTRLVRIKLFILDGWMDGWMEGGREGGMDGFINLLNHAFERNDDVLISISSAIL